MKQFITRTFITLALIAAGLGVTAQAQVSHVIKVNIPFTFTVGDKDFPAGEYSLAQPLQHFLVLRNARGNVIAHAFTQSVESLTPADATKVKFYAANGQHTLAEVWQQQNISGERLYLDKPRINVSITRSNEAPVSPKGNRP
jgi:hypothetical protein